MLGNESCLQLMYVISMTTIITIRVSYNKFSKTRLTKPVFRLKPKLLQIHRVFL